MILSVTTSSAPLFRGVAQSLIEAIEGGRLVAGESLPPTRDLAEHLSLSRDTVVKAYQYLASLGYVEASRTRGTFVKALLHQSTPQQEFGPCVDASLAAGSLSDYGARMMQYHSHHSSSADVELLNFGAPAAQFLPLRKWRELMQKHSHPSQLRYAHNDLGLIELRLALAAFLNRARAVQCQAEDIAVFSQSQQALNLLVRLLTNPGDAVVIEEPGFGGIRNIAEGQGLRLIPVPLDHEGIDLSGLNETGAKIKLIYVTPAHHDPTGAVMSSARRQELLQFAQRHDAWIIEDDYDSNFDYANKAQPALKALQPEGKVIYLSTMWKILYPLTAIGYCVFPKSIAPAVKRAKALSEPCASSWEQLTLAEMLADGHIERHTRKIGREYNSRRRAFISAITAHFGPLVELPKASGAMQYLVRFKGHLASDAADKLIVDAGNRAGLRLVSSAYAYMTGAQNGEFIIDFTSMDEETMAKSLDCFAAIIKGQSGMIPSLQHFGVNDQTKICRLAQSNARF